MATLTGEERRSLRDAQFALKKERKYPIHDYTHAVNAKARARQMYDKGKLTAEQYASIVRQADDVIKKQQLFTVYKR